MHIRPTLLQKGGMITVRCCWIFDMTSTSGGKIVPWLQQQNRDWQWQKQKKASARLLLSTAVANSYTELARLYANLDTVESALDVRKKDCRAFAQKI